MKTEDLMNMLATGAGAVDARLPARRIGMAIGVGLLGAGVLMAGTLGVRADIAHAISQEGMFWVKFAFVALSAAGSVVLVSRLCQPGARFSGLPAMLAAPVLAIWTLAAFALIEAGPGNRAPLLLGESWAVCPFGIALLSLPVLVAVMWAMKGLAPTRLRLAGAAAGLLAGTLGAVVYTLHCPEVAAPFLGTWYVLGMLIPTAVGALLGPRVLRW